MGRPRIGFRLTGRGLSLVLLAPVVAFGGIMFGITDLVALGSVFFAGVVAGLLLTLFAPRDVRLARSGPRDEIRDGQTALVVYDLQARWAGLWPVRGTADLLARSGAQPEPLAITGVRVNNPTVVRFETLPRGLYVLGPGWVLRSDPMGLAQRIQDVVGSASLHVWPRTVAIAAPLLPGLADSGTPATFTSEGYEFRQLREFVTGDDRRRIHWPSSAKRDVLLVRETQDDESAQVSVVLDCRAEAYRESDPEPDRLVRSLRHPGFELAVSVAASLVESYLKAGLECSLSLVSPGRPEVDVRDAGTLGKALNLMAGAALTTAMHASELVDMLTPDRTSRSCAVIVVGGRADAAVAEGLNRARAGHRTRLALLCDEGKGPMGESGESASAQRVPWGAPAGPGRRATVPALEQLPDALAASLVGLPQQLVPNAAREPGAPS